MTVPVIHRDTATELFFDSTARGELLIRRCAGCGAHAAPQSTACPGCQNPATTWAAAAGTGTVVAWTAVHGRPGDGAPASEAVSALIELTEGPWLYAPLRNLGPGERPWAGMSVVVAFERPEGGEAIPVFRPAV
ncbi:Zn-ribbon domain-containing OB-fold protein [Streptomyces sp. T028]|uniref:Zn-ribbon domain-containing OB-fold protein n=1 Tax=Streptomyces sp. T028 TaxID=3394379 RepID=UPI003A872530